MQLQATLSFGMTSLMDDAYSLLESDHKNYLFFVLFFLIIAFILSSSKL